jgi:hypothetical protein
VLDVSTNVIGSQEPTAHLRQQLLRNLQRSKLFRQVVNDPGASGGEGLRGVLEALEPLSLTVVVTQMKQAGLGGAMFGANAGIALDVAISEVGREEPLGTYTFQYFPTKGITTREVVGSAANRITSLIEDAFHAEGDG